MVGDVEIGVCIMQMEVGFDIGFVLMCQMILIGVEEMIGQLYDWLFEMGVKLIVEVLCCLMELIFEVQLDEGVIYVEKIDKFEVWIDWFVFVVEVDCKICGLLLFLGVWCEINGEWIKLFGLKFVDGVGDVGQVLDGFVIVCVDGVVEIICLQCVGKKLVSVEDVLRGMILFERI